MATIVKPPLHSLHDNTIRWLSGIVGEYQRQVLRLERENAGLRDQVREFKRQLRHDKAMARVAGT